MRALVHRQDQVSGVEALGAQDVIVGDMRSQEVMQQAVQGVGAVYHICPNMSPDELAIGMTVIAAAQSAGVEHFVYHSVLKPQIKAMPLNMAKCDKSPKRASAFEWMLRRVNCLGAT